MTLRNEWQTAKKRLLNPKAGFPADIAKQLGKGADLGPSLEKLEKAVGYPAQQKILPEALKGKTLYEAGINKKRAELKGAKPPNKEQLLALDEFEKDLKRIWAMIQDLCQPPRGRGRATKIKVLNSRVVGRGLKLQNFKLEQIEVEACIIIDEALDEIIKNELQGALYINISSAVNKEYMKHEKAFLDTIDKIDKALTNVILDPAARTKKTEEANEVLRYYAKIVEDRLNAVVDQQWKEFIGRQQHLKAFHKECTITVVTNTIAIGVAAASAAMSFGAAIVNVLVIAKAVAELAKVAGRITRNIDAAEEDVRKRLKYVQGLCENRLKALQTGEGQVGNKAGEMAKNAVTFLLGSYAKDFVNTVSYTEKVAIEYSGRISTLEKQAAEMYLKIQKMTAEFPSSKDAPDAKTSAKVNKAFNAFRTLEAQFVAFNQGIRDRLPVSQKALHLCGLAKKLDPEVGKFNTFLTVVTTTLAVYSVANLGTLIGTADSIVTHAGSVVTALE